MTQAVGDVLSKDLLTQNIFLIRWVKNNIFLQKHTDSNCCAVQMLCRECLQSDVCLQMCECPIHPNTHYHIIMLSFLKNNNNHFTLKIQKNKNKKVPF